MTEKTLGELRIRTSFNPSEQGIVDQIKQKTAELINLMDSISHNPNEGGERVRLIALARTDYESAAMWAVKAATF